MEFIFFFFDHFIGVMLTSCAAVSAKPDPNPTPR